MMNNNKEVLNYCPNFNKIVNFESNKEDLVSDKLIYIYQNFVFKIDIHNTEDISMVKELDYVLMKYIDDYLFRKELKKVIVHIKVKKSCNDILRTIVQSILDIFKEYLFLTTRKITIARWI